MDRTKLTAFLLLVASLGAVLFVFDLASTPILVPEMARTPGWPPIPPGCAAVMLLVVLLPLASIPGVVGLILWLRMARRRVERRQEIASEPAQETALQNGYDQLACAFVEGSLEEDELLNFHKVYESLGKARQIRWYRFLAASEAPGKLLLWIDPTTPSEPAKLSQSSVRTLAFCLSLIGLVCFLWTALSALFGPNGNALSAFGCVAPGLSALIGGVGLVLMIRRESRYRSEEREWSNLAGKVLLDSCERRLERLSEHGLSDPEAQSVKKLAQASVFDALEQLDGERRSHLLLFIHARGLTTALGLQGASLREAKLAEADLAGAVLTGVDLSGAILTGARLEKCVLRNCRLMGADLRGAMLQGADLRQSDLRGAWLQQCDLRQADLRKADLRGTNLWQSNMSGVDLRESLVSKEQLGSVASLEGALLL